MIDLSPPRSQRMDNVQDPIISVIGRLTRENPGTISLGQGIAYFPPPSAADQALQTFSTEPGVHQYTDAAGSTDLLELIEQKLRSFNRIDCAAQNLRIVITAGANMGFLNALYAITDPNDEVILSVPYYFNHEMAIRMVSCIPVLAATDDQFHLDLSALSSLITDRTRAIVTVSPNNPSGAVYSPEALAAVNQLCRDAGIYHISDEAYEYFVYRGTASSPASGPSANAHTISLYSLSKAYGFASWRIGYMVLPQQLYAAVLKAQDTNLICPPGISQYAATAILRDAPDYWQGKVKTLARVRKDVLNALTELGQLVEIPPAEGALYVLLRVNARDTTDLDLARRLIRDYGVAVIPGVAFGLKGDCFLRISYAGVVENSVSAGIKRLVQGIFAIVGNRR